MQKSQELLEALRRVTQGANAEWSAFVLLIVQLCAQAHAVFSTDEVHALLDAIAESLPVPTTPEKRALGPVILLAQQNGWIKPFDAKPFTISVRKENHGRPVRCWESLLHGKGDARTEMLNAISKLEQSA